MNYRTTLQSIIRYKTSTLEQSPATEYKHQQQNKARRKPTPQHGEHRQNTGAVFGVAVSFFVMVFVSQRNAAHLFFLKDREKK